MEVDKYQLQQNLQQQTWQQIFPHNRSIEMLNVKLIEKEQIVLANVKSDSFDEVNNNIKVLGQELTSILKKLYLTINIQFNDSNGRLNFSSNLLKLANQNAFLFSLTLRILGYSTKEQWVRIIECLRSFPILYSLELNFHDTHLDDQIAEGISSQINKLQRIHILKIYLNFDVYVSRKLSRNAVASINCACYQLKDLEIFDFPLRFERKIQGNLPISNFSYFRTSNSYQRALSSFLPYMIEDFKIFKKQIESEANVITKVVFYEHQLTRYHMDFVQCSQNKYLERLQIIQKLPYLTQFTTNFVTYEKAYQLKVKQLVKNIQDQVSLRMSQLVQTIVFQRFITYHLQVNPNLVLVDLWIE